MVDVKNWWLTCIEDETLHNMHRDLLRHGVFDSSDEGRLTTLALVAIKKKESRRRAKDRTTP